MLLLLRQAATGPVVKAKISGAWITLGAATAASVKAPSGWISIKSPTTVTDVKALVSGQWRSIIS